MDKNSPSDKSEEYKIISFELIKLPDVHLLFQKVFNVSIKYSEFKKKYETDTYFGLHPVGFCAYSKSNNLCAFYVIFPVKLNTENGNTILVAQSGDTMTHPEHSGKGLFVLLSTKTYELAKEKGIQFVFGFPNQNSYPGFIKKLNWQHEGNLVVYKRKIKTIKLQKGLSILLPRTKVFLTFIKAVLRRFVTLRDFPSLMSISNEILHNHEFFQYKQKESILFVEYRTSFAVIKLSYNIQIGFISGPIASTNDLIKKLEKFARLTGFDEIQYITNKPNKNEDDYMQSFSRTTGLACGFLPINSSYDFKRIRFTYLDLDTF